MSAVANILKLVGVSRRRKLRQALNDSICLTVISDICSRGNIKIKNIFDIGAYRGEWALNMSRHFPEAEFFLFEANEKFKEEPAATGHPYFICTLARDKRARPFFRVNGTGDSLYKEISPIYNEIDATYVVTESLESVIKRNGLPVPEFAKIDVQGAEIEILEGCKRVMSETLFLMLECPVTPYNHSAPTFSRYIDFMRDGGWEPLEISEIHRSKIENKIIQIDMLFANRRRISLA
jgi:FkbM family methyltransferase